MRDPKPVSPLPHFPLCAKCVIIRKTTMFKFQRTSRTCVGVGIVAVAGAGVLGVAGVEAAVGWGLVLGTGCVEGGVFAVGWAGVRGVNFGAGGSARSTLFSWRVILSEWRVSHIQVTTFSLCRSLTQTKYPEFNGCFWDWHTLGLRIQVVV